MKNLIVNGNHRVLSEKFVELGLGDAFEDDLILISDVDEIPCLDYLAFEEVTDNGIF